MYAQLRKKRRGVWPLVSVTGGSLLLAAACATSPAQSSLPGPSFERGASLYASHCAACHGSTGQGDGAMAGFLDVRPRDFRSDKFRFISASYGEMATEEDISRYIRSGSRVSQMPAHPQLSESELQELVAYVREFRKFGLMDEVEDSFLEEDEDYTLEDLEDIAGDRMEAGPAVVISGRSLGYEPDSRLGAELYAANCASCHGLTGLGDGPEELFDESGNAILPRNLRRGNYRGGSLDRDLYWRIRCGIPGTPMPALDEATVSDEGVWQLVDYLRFLSASH